MGLSAPVLKGMRAVGLAAFTPFQSRAIPLIFSGQDVLGMAPAGSGRTAAYLLPILSHLERDAGGLRALVLAPARERVRQVEACARHHARFTSLRIVAACEGTALAAQDRALRVAGADLLVATPGRLLDLHARQAANLEDVETLVLDEADRMVELGEAADLRRILKLLPETRQTLLFSATLPPELNRVAREALLDPVRVEPQPAADAAAGLARAV
jgi:ATP-dependent RNA helicase RhlE